jgi:hypothetical protein
VILRCFIFISDIVLGAGAAAAAGAGAGAGYGNGYAEGYGYGAGYGAGYAAGAGAGGAAAVAQSTAAIQTDSLATANMSDHFSSLAATQSTVARSGVTNIAAAGAGYMHRAVQTDYTGLGAGESLSAQVATQTPVQEVMQQVQAPVPQQQQQQPYLGPPGPGGYGYGSETMTSSTYNFKETRTMESYNMQNMRLSMGADALAQAQAAGQGFGASTAQSLMAAEEIRVDCALLTDNGRYVVTGSIFGPPQVWDMKVRNFRFIFRFNLK